MRYARLTVSRLEATSERAVEVISLELLEQHAVDVPPDPSML